MGACGRQPIDVSLTLMFLSLSLSLTSPLSKNKIFFKKVGIQLCVRETEFILVFYLLIIASQV